MNEEGYHEIFGAVEGMKEDKESWKSFFVWLKERGLTGVRMIVGDKNLGILETIPKEVSMMQKAISAQESKEAEREKAEQVVLKLHEMKLLKEAQKIEDRIEETLTYMNFPCQHWIRIRTNNTIERLNREIKRRTKAIGAFPDGNSALILVCARLHYVAGTDWGARRYMNMDHLSEMDLNTESDNIAG